MLLIRSDDEDDAPNTEEVKKPKVIVDNKPLTRINCADDDEEKPESSNTMNQNQETKKKKKKKKNKNTNSTSNNVGNSAAPVASQSTVENPNKIDLVKPEKVKPVAKIQQVSQPLKSAAQKVPKMAKVQLKQKDRLSKVAHKTIDKRNKQNKSKSLKMSDERLKAFGINPKKFVKQQKYAARNNQQNPTKTNKKPQASQQSKQTIKLKNKLKKALKSPKWAQPLWTVWINLYNFQ